MNVLQVNISPNIKYLSFLLFIMNDAAMNMFAHVSLWMSPVTSQGCIYTSGNAMSKGVRMNVFASACQVALWKGPVGLLILLLTVNRND